MQKELGKNPQEAYKNGPPQAQQQPELTTEQLAKMQKDFEDALPLVRARAEYEKLNLDLLEYSVLIGQRSPDNVPGLLGLELKAREMQALGFIAHVTNEIARNNEAQKEEEEYMKMQSAKAQAAPIAKEETATGATDEAGNSTGNTAV